MDKQVRLPTETPNLHDVVRDHYLRREPTSFLASLPPDVLDAIKRGDFADADEFGDPAFLIRR